MEERQFLANIPSEYLGQYIDQCLTQPYQDSGLALQDIVNEIGSRLGAVVTHGKYRGNKNTNGFDGLWVLPNQHSIVVEVKTTDAFKIKLDTIAGYRDGLINDGTIKASSSMLLIVGRQSTGDLEAQIRGSRHAWDLRIISMDALLRLMAIKEGIDDPITLSRIHNILIPREFTRLDEIAEILFSTAEEIKGDQPEDEGEPETDDDHKAISKEPKFTPVSFHNACILRIENKLSVSLIKRSKSLYTAPDNQVAVNCSVSKEHNPDTSPNYWFAFHPHQLEALKKHAISYVSFGCRDSKTVILIPLEEFEPWLTGTWTTTKEDKTYWHVVIRKSGNEYTLHRRKGEKKIDLTGFLI
jgi:hypothetical protein